MAVREARMSGAGELPQARRAPDLVGHVVELHQAAAMRRFQLAPRARRRQFTQLGQALRRLRSVRFEKIQHLLG